MQGISDADRVVSLFLRLKDCARKYKQLTENRGKTFIILASLREYELKNGRHLTVGDIAENSGLALPNVSRLLAPAEKQGLIRREKCGRNVNVTLTEEGEKTCRLAGRLLARHSAGAESADARRDRGIRNGIRKDTRLI